MRNRTQLHVFDKLSSKRRRLRDSLRVTVTATAFICSTLLMGIMPAPAAVAPAVSTVLPNGATLLTRTDRLAPRVALSVLVRSGAGDETMESAGWRRLLTDAMLRASLHGTPAGATPTKQAAEEKAKTEDKPATGDKPAGEAAPEAPAASENTAAENSAPPKNSAGVGPARGIDELQLEAEKWGGRLGASVGEDYIEFWAVGDSAGSSQLLDLLLGLAFRPRLADEDIDAARRRLLARLEAGNEPIAVRATNALASQLYRDGRGEPVAYGLPTNGTFKSLTALSPDKIRRLYDYFFVPARLVVSAAGDVNPAQLKTVLDKPGRSAAWGRAAKPLTHAKAPIFATPDKSQPPLTVRQMVTPTAWVFVAYNTAGLNAGDYVALRVLSAAMGESSKARLPIRLMGSRHAGRSRATNEATSQVAVQLTPRRFAGEMIFFAQTSPQNVDSVKNAILDEVHKLQDRPLSRVELESARNFVSGNWAVERETLRERAFQMGLAAVANAAADTTWPARVNAVTAADVQRVAKKYLENYAVALIMPQD